MTSAASDCRSVGHKKLETGQQAVEAEGGAALQEDTHPHCKAAKYTPRSHCAEILFESLSSFYSVLCSF